MCRRLLTVSLVCTGLTFAIWVLSHSASKRRWNGSCLNNEQHIEPASCMTGPFLPVATLLYWLSSKRAVPGSVRAGLNDPDCGTHQRLGPLGHRCQGST